MTRSVLSPPADFVFPVRLDQNGYRLAYKLGNERGPCPFRCAFCGVGSSAKVSSAENIARFDSLHARYLSEFDGRYHAGIFNRGNVTNLEEFSLRTLDHILEALEKDGRITYVSLNSREGTATPAVLDRLAMRETPFPIHFIFGQESFSGSARQVLGKSNQGELERFVQKLKGYNQGHPFRDDGKRYVFGLDVNLLFLPELYLDAGEARDGHEAKIARGLAGDLRELLSRIDPLVPIEVNIHPYYAVEALPYKQADLFMLLRILPTLQSLVDEHNRAPGARRTRLFVGAVLFDRDGRSASDARQVQSVEFLKESIDQFNRTGYLPDLRTCPPVPHCKPAWEIPE